MPRTPIIVLVSIALVTGILAVAAHAEWLVCASFSIPFVLALSGRSRVTSLRPIARTTLAIAVLSLLSVWSIEPDRRLVDRAIAVVPGKGERMHTACVARIPSTVNRPVQARCLTSSGWIDLPLRLFEEDLPTEDPGSVFWFTASIQQPASTKNPGEPNRLALSRLSGIAAWASISRRDSVVLVTRPESEPTRFREHVEKKLDALLPDYEAGNLVRAMITGDRSRLSVELVDAFRKSGISHVLAVSGLHVSIVILLALLPVSLVSSLIGLGWGGRIVFQLASVGALLFLVTGVVGSGPSVVRAGIFGLVMIVSRFLDRSGSAALSALFLSMTIQLTWDPRVLFDAGFLLSHAAIAGLVYVGHGKSIVSGLRSSLFATWSTSPFVALFFGFVPVAGIVANIVAIPLTSVIVTAGTMSLVLGGFPVLAAPLAVSAVLAADALIELSKMFSERLDFLSMTSTAGTIAFISGTLIALRLTRRGLTASILLVTAISYGVQWCPVRVPLSMTILDLGQGDGTVLSTPESRIVVVDTGPPRSSVVLNFLRLEGNRRIHALFLTHLHSDHIGGLSTITGHLPIDTLYVPAGVELPDSLLHVAKGIRRLRAGDTVSVDPEVRVRVLSPVGDEGGDDPNASSLVLRVDHGATSILLTGDAERDAEQTMASDWDEWLDVDVVKVAHHGSRTSSTPFFVDRASPSSAVVSVGFNSYGLPSMEVIERWKNSGARVHLTRMSGAFCLQSDGKSFTTGC